MLRALVMQLSMDKPVAHIVLEHSECAVVFNRYRFDYCGTSPQTLLAACSQRGVDPSKVLIDCENAIRRREVKSVDLRGLSTQELVTNVIARHHRYLRQTLPFVRMLAAKVARSYGERQPALRHVAQIVRELSDTLLDHLDDEERDLFSAVLSETSPMPVVADSLHEDHDRVAELLTKLRTYCADYVCPDWAPVGYRALFAELAHLEADTRRHVHVENHVLLPRFHSAR